MSRPVEPSAPHALASLLDRCRITDGRTFRLEDHATGGPVPAGLDKHQAESLMAAGIGRLAALQERLYAGATWSLLVVLQAMDAAGKDGTIKHVLSGVNPQGVQVTAFEAPGPEDLAHDVLWRVSRALPARGMIGIFNRSHYEDVLVPRVHPEVLARQRLPPGLTARDGFWQGRLEDIAAFERHLGREGTRVVKVFLNLGREEQRQRLLARLDEPDKLWKFDPADLVERRLWDDYRAAYAQAIAATAMPEAPWFVIPADRKWLTRLLVLEIVNEALAALDLDQPRPSPEVQARWEEARRMLEDEPRGRDGGDGA